MRGIFGLRNAILESRVGNKLVVDPALVHDLGKNGIEECKVGAGIDLQMQDVLLAGHLFAGIDGDRAARIYDDHLRALSHAWNHVVQKQVGLGFQRVGADDHHGVGQLIVLVVIVQLAHAHVAGRMDFGVVGRPIVDAAVPDLHRLEVEFAGAPGVLVAAGRRRGRTSRRTGRPRVPIA